MQTKRARQTKRVVLAALTVVALAVPSVGAMAQLGAIGQPPPYMAPHPNPSWSYTAPQASEVPVSPTTPGTLPGALPGPGAIPLTGGPGCLPPGTTDVTGQNPVGAPPNNSVYAGCY